MVRKQAGRRARAQGAPMTAPTMWILVGMAITVAGQIALHTWAMYNTRQCGVPEEHITPWEGVLPIIFWPLTVLYALGSTAFVYAAIACGFVVEEDEGDDE